MQIAKATQTLENLFTIRLVSPWRVPMNQTASVLIQGFSNLIVYSQSGGSRTLGAALQVEKLELQRTSGTRHVTIYGISKPRLYRHHFDIGNHVGWMRKTLGRINDFIWRSL